MKTTANIALGAMVSKEASDQFDRMIASPLMHSAAEHFLKTYTADELDRTINSGAFLKDWVENGGESACMIGLPAAALITVMRGIEEAWA